MIRLLTALLLLTYSLFGWASAYPDDYNKLIIHSDGDIIKAEDFNNNNNIHKQNIINLKESIDTIEAGTGPQGPQGEQGPPGPQGPPGAADVAAGLTCNTNQVIRWNGTEWACADDVLATLNCDVGDRLVRGDNGWECSNSYSVSGNLTGMDSGNSVGLTLNGVSLTMSANGLFTFPNEVEAGQSYTVQVQAQPPTGTETCEVTANGSGNVLAPITDVAVHCYPIAEAYVASFDKMASGMTNMFDMLTPNIDTSRICDDIDCEFELANVSDHSNCDISWSGAAADGAYAPPDVFKSIDRVILSNIYRFDAGQPLTINLSCPSQ